jgi:hypothetical protein
VPGISANVSGPGPTPPGGYGQTQTLRTSGLDGSGSTSRQAQAEQSSPGRRQSAAVSHSSHIAVHAARHGGQYLRAKPHDTQPRLDGHELDWYEHGEVPVHEIVVPSQQVTLAEQVSATMARSAPSIPPDAGDPSAAITAGATSTHIAQHSTIFQEACITGLLFRGIRA